MKITIKELGKILELFKTLMKLELCSDTDLAEVKTKLIDRVSDL